MMRRGFFNSTKSGQTKQRLLANEDPSKKKLDLSEPLRLPYGVVKEPGLPEGYKCETVKPTLLSTDTQHQDDALVFTTQPLQMLGTKLADVPGGWTECLITGKAKRTLLATPGYPQPVPAPTHRNCYVIKESPGKGLGMFATCNIRQGDLVVAERPIMLVSGIMGVSSEKVRGYSVEQVKQICLAEQEKIMEACFDRVPPENREAYLALANSHLHDGSGKLMGILRTNGFHASGLDDTEGAPKYSAVFKDASRINHSCGPNTTRSWDLASLSTRFWAARDISKGEEITIDYVPLVQTARARSEKLAPYDIKCTCFPCENHRVSDKNRLEILSSIPSNAATIEMIFNHWLDNPDASAREMLDQALLHIALLESEQLQCFDGYAPLLLLVLRCYLSLADEKKALEYAPKAGRAHMAANNGDRTYLDKYSSLAKMKSDKLWGARHKATRVK